MNESMETDVWIGQGFSPNQGVLRLAAGQLSLTLDGTIAFDTPIAELQMKWPWYGADCQFWAHSLGNKYFVSFQHTHNTSYSWCQGIKRGRLWNRAIKAAAADSSSKS